MNHSKENHWDIRFTFGVSCAIFATVLTQMRMFSCAGRTTSGRFQFPDSERSTRGREARQLPLTLLDQVSDNSLLVSVELNGIVYQGVLFARQNRPGSPTSTEEY